MNFLTAQERATLIIDKARNANFPLEEVVRHIEEAEFMAFIEGEKRMRAKAAAMVKSGYDILSIVSMIRNIPIFMGEAPSNKIPVNEQTQQHCCKNDLCGMACEPHHHEGSSALRRSPKIIREAPGMA